MRNVKTNLNKFPKTILDQSKEMLENSSYNIEVETDHSITFKFKEEKEVNTTLVFNTDGNLINYTCNCGKISLCKHVGASLIVLEERKSISIKEELTSDKFKDLCFYNPSILNRPIEVRKIITSLIERYSVNSIVNCLLKSLLTNLNSVKVKFFINFFNFFEYSKLPDEFVSLLKNFLKTLIKEYDNEESKLDLLEGEKLFYKFFQNQIYGSDIIADVFYESLNEGLFPKNDILFSYLCTETFYSTKDDVALTLNGLETLSKNAKYVNSGFPISNKSVEQLIIQMINSDDTYKYVEMFFEITVLFNRTRINFLKEIFLRIYNKKDKEEDAKKVLRLYSKSFDVIELIESSLPRNEENEIWYSFIDSLASSYYSYSFNSSYHMAKRLASKNGNITLEEILHLIENEYPFYSFEDFFDNKKVIVCEESEKVAETTIFNNVKKLFIQEDFLESPLNFEPLKSCLKELPTKVIETLFLVFGFNYPDLFFKFDLLDKVGFKGVK